MFRPISLFVLLAVVSANEDGTVVSDTDQAPQMDVGSGSGSGSGDSPVEEAPGDVVFVDFVPDATTVGDGNGSGNVATDDTEADATDATVGDGGGSGTSEASNEGAAALPTLSSISGTATVSGFANAAEFTEGHKTAFSKAVAATIGDDVTFEQVTVTVADARLRSRSRRLGDLAISYIVSGLTAADASVAADTIAAATPAEFLATLTTKMEADTALTIPVDMAVASIAASVDVVVVEDTPVADPDAGVAGASAASISSLVTLSAMIVVAALC
jgi:hypothetical protein